VKVFYFMNPSGKIPKDKTIKNIIQRVQKKTEKTERVYYRTGPSVNNPTTLLKELNNLKMPWEVVVVQDNEFCLLSNDKKYKLLEKLSVSSNSLTGKIAFELLECFY
jgi:hypothetical protein